MKNSPPEKSLKPAKKPHHGLGKTRPPMPGAGRPPVPIDWKTVAECCRIQCTIPEIAGLIGVNKDTLYERCPIDNGQDFPSFYAEKSEGGKCSLRRSQWKVATQTENPALLIWAGKQYLGQSEKVDHGGKVDLNLIGEFKIELVKP